MPFTSSKRPSCTLFCSIAGPHGSATAADVTALLQPFCSGSGSSTPASSLEIAWPPPDSKGCYWFATFSGPQGAQQAAAALQELHGKPSAAVGGRLVKCKFAKWVDEPPEGQPKLPLHQAQLSRLPVARTTEEAGIPGLFVLPDFISQEEEAQLLQHIDQQPWQHVAKRRVQHYGYRFEYMQRGVDLQQQAGSMPEWSRGVVQKVQALPHVPVIDQLTVNEYTPGVGISPHVDTHSSFTGAVLSLSLLGSCTMVFRKACVAPAAAGAGPDNSSPDEQQQQIDRQVCVFMPPRTLLVMSGEARYAWQHYIPHRKSDWVNKHVPRAARRVSLTLRKVRGFPCDCSYPEHCDSQLGVQPPTRIALLQQQQQQAQQQQQHSQPEPTQPTPQQQDASSPAAAAADSTATSVAGVSAQALEDAHVHQVYDAIASHFSSTRFAVWPKVRAFLDSLAPGSVVADVGCGNGKYLGLRPDLAVLGCDRSAGLAAVAAARLAPGSIGSLTNSRGPAATRAADVFVCDALQLCYRPCSCDALVCIAVLHHISSRQRRLALLQQLADVLRPGGRGLVTVWATLQEDPRKTIQRWHKIDNKAGSAQQQGTTTTATQDSQQPQQPQQEQPDDDGGVVEGPDFFVPWHLPFHKAAGTLAAHHQHQHHQQQQQMPPEAGGKSDANSSSSSSSSALASAGAAGQVAVDAAKGAVVLQRYYHLFEQGELEALTAQVPGLQVTRVFYDRSNWCVEFVKQQA